MRTGGRYDDEDQRISVSEKLNGQLSVMKQSNHEMVDDTVQHSVRLLPHLFIVQAEACQHLNLIPGPAAQDHTSNLCCKVAVCSGKPVNHVTCLLSKSTSLQV